LLPIDIVNAQVQMTRMPTRLEEALIDPNIGAILRSNLRDQHAAAAPVRVASLPKVITPSAPTYSNERSRFTAIQPKTPAAPTYSNESSRFSAIRPEIDESASTAAKLKMIEQTEMPPIPVRKPAEISFEEKAPPTPTIQKTPPAKEAVTTQDQMPPQAYRNKNTDILEPLAPVEGQLRFRVTGVSAMIENQPADVSIEVYNPTAHPIGPVEVNVKVPVELTITRFDKDAWLDAERRIIAFKLERVEPGAIEKIGMKGVSESKGQTILDVALLSGDTMVAQRSVKTQVFSEQLARKDTFGDVAPKDTIQK